MIAAGTMIGSYRIKQPLGAGAMGQVYLALDSRDNRLVAIKVLAHHLTADRDRLSRFRREGRAAARLTHPNIGLIYETGDSSFGPFIAMEYVKGVTLSEFQDKKPLPVPTILRYGVQLADALWAAHAAGIVHRDLKPANIMRTEQDELKILDFGLAKLFRPSEESDHPSESLQTNEGTILGTLHYMSPEQALGRPADPRSDIFSLGSILYEMATGRRPFQQDSSLQVLYAIINKAPEAIARVNDAIPAELERIISKCHEKDPAKRYQTAADLLIDLRQGRGEPAVETVTPRRNWVAGLGATIVGGGGVAWWYFNQGKGHLPRSLAVLPFVNEAAGANLDLLAEGLISELSQFRDLRVIARSATKRFEGATVDLKAVGSELDVEAALVGRVSRQGELLELRVELVRTGSGETIWGHRYTTRPTSLASLSQTIAGAVAKALELSGG